MKQLLLVFIFYLNAYTSSAQKGLPAFGKIEKADLDMVDCDFDKGADAVKLIDWCSMNYDRGTYGMTLFKTVYEHRVRIKILKEKGITYANVSIPFFSRNNEEKILRLDARTFNIDESGKISTTDVGKSSIYTKKINKNFSELIIAFPEVKVGSVIEYRYSMERETWTNIKDWYFQDRIPVRHSEYQVKIPLLLLFTEKPAIAGKMETRKEEYEDMISVNDAAYSFKMIKKNYIMRNLVGIRDEPYMGAAKDYQQRIEFQLSQLDMGNGDIRDLRVSWSNVINDLKKDEDFGLQLEKQVPLAEAVINQANSFTDFDSKIKTVFNYVRHNINWDGQETIVAYAGINNAIEKKLGSNADINLLLINLLNRAGIKAIPILFSTRENGLVNTFYPSTDQFNTVMAYVTVNDKYYILDATDRTSSYKLIPSTVVNTKGFLVEGSNGKWIDVVENKSKYKIMVASQAEIDETGNMTGESFVNCSGYARKDRCKHWVMDKEKFKQDFFVQNSSTMKIADLTVNNLEADSMPFEQKVKFSSALSSSGEYLYFTLNQFSGLDKNPFIADERQTDIDFGFLQDFQVFGNYKIHEGYKFESLPENISLLMPDKSIVFNRFIKADENLLNVRITVEFKSAFYTASGYPEFKEFYKKMFDKLNEQIVIKRK